MPFNVLVPLYPGFNTLDVNGPLDILANYALRQSNSPQHPPPFTITTTALDTHTPAYEFITVRRDVSFDDAIHKIKAHEFDVLLVPGCGGGADDALLRLPAPAPGKVGPFGAHPKILDVIRAFLEHDNEDGKPKWLVSVCVGAMFACAAGAFAGKHVTTHFAALGKLAEVCEAYGAVPRSITRARWVDGGEWGGEEVEAEGKREGKSGGGGSRRVPTRILSTGGISCGLDGTLYLVEQMLSREAALSVAVTMDYAWRNV